MSGADAPGSSGTTWEGYSNYEAVSKDVAQSVANAVENYAWLDSIHRDGGNPEADQIAMARSAVLAAALRLVVEMREEAQNGNDEYGDILERWTGTDPQDDSLLFADVWDGSGKWTQNGAAPVGGAPAQLGGGYIRAFRDADLSEDVPEWAGQFAVDIRTAGFRLGYLQAGRREQKPAEDPIEGDARSMLEGI